MDYSIAIILPNTPTYLTTKQVLKKLKLNYPLYCESEKNAVKVAKELISKGTIVIISAGITFQYLEKFTPALILELPFSGIEAAIATKNAISYSKKIAHIGTSKLFRYLKKSLEFLNIDSNAIHFCELDSKKTIEAQTLEIISKGYEVIIGGHAVAKIAEMYGIHVIEINVDEYVIESTILNAQLLVERMMKEKKNNEFEKAILQTTSEGIIAIDENRIIYKSNPAAENIVGDSLKNKNFEDALKENNVVDIKSATFDQLKPTSKYTPVILNESPIIISGIHSGSVISIKALSEVKSLQYRIRKELFNRGLYATYTFDDIKGKSNLIFKLKEKAAIYAKYSSPVLITGETGTGKELFAQSIHNSSERKSQPWVAVNCAALPDNLIESELFGYVRGAFTGANKEGKAGFFELANGGTIFLDEISELPISIQSKLLRVIQEGEIIRVGGNNIIHVDVRIICSSNKNLIEMIDEGNFKNDLYYRLNVLEINLPPLRERKEDIEELALSLLKKFNVKHNKSIVGFSTEAIDKLKKLTLPGNIRELSNIIERMSIFTEGTIIDEQLVDETIRDMNSHIIVHDCNRQELAYIQRDTFNSLNGELKDIHKEVILATLEKCGGNKAAAARQLGIAPSTLWRKLKKYNITIDSR